MSKQKTLPENLEKIIVDLEKKSREVGLDFFTTIFELVDYKKLHEVAAYGGLPKRYPHWRWGMEYDKLMKNYEYGLATIYEMVINNNPCYAYLLESNHLSTQKTVIAHVYGHSDFFKNNIWFSKTNRKMLNQSANNASIIREIIETVSYTEVEDFIDTCLSLENLIDPGELFSYSFSKEKNKEEKKETAPVYSKSYLESFLKDKKTHREAEIQKGEKHVFNEERDILKFLSSHAELNTWQSKILDIIRSEAYYFLPQRQTKILNEGWATYWHSKMMTEIYPLDISEIIDYCCQYSSIVENKGGHINPYRLGLELFKNIHKKWDEKSNNGTEKIFEVRKIHNDLSFLDNFLDEDFCHETKMFLYDYDPQKREHILTDRKFKDIKPQILSALTNCGWPIIKVIDNNFHSKGELLLKHSYDGTLLHQGKSFETLKRLYKIWKKPVHIETVVGDQKKILSFNGEDISVKK